MKRNQSNILLAAGLILMAALLRIINQEMHWYNLAPIAAVGLFAGAIIKEKRFAYILPLLSMFIADLYFQLFTSVNGFYGMEQLFVYGGMAVVTYLGTIMGKVNLPKVVGYSLVGSLAFFVLSNFGSFLSGMWGLNGAGFVKTYVMAIPFFKNTVISDLVGNGVLFGLYFLAQRAFTPEVQKAA